MRADDLIASLALFAIRAWIIMIAIGAIHSTVPGVPPIGYLTAVLVHLVLVVGTANPILDTEDWTK